MIPPRDMDIHVELYKDIDKASPERLAFTRRAFESLSGLDRPRILDAGCGRGDVAVELARLGGGEVIGIDIDGEALGTFEKRIGEEGLEERVCAIHGSMFEMPFPPESFDVIWAEGSLHIVGIEKGLSTLRGFIRPGGFLVAHEMVWIRPDPPAEVLDRWQGRFPGIRSIDEIIEYIDKYDYRLITHFTLPEDFWSRDYYEPLEKRITLLREKYSDNPGALAILDGEQLEVDLYNESSRWVGSVFFVMQRDDG
jgi:ubiquinone/menaquinone biosynthesis C-methylase UbiE